MRFQASIIIQSFKHIIAVGSEVVDHAYDLMMKMYPELADVVTSEKLEYLKDQLLNSLIFIVDHFDEEQVATDYLENIGKKLKKFGLKSDYFEQFKDVMMRSVGAHLNEKWTPKVKEQWSLAFDYINYYVMKSAQIPMDRELLLPDSNEGSANIDQKLEDEVIENITTDSVSSEIAAELDSSKLATSNERLDAQDSKSVPLYPQSFDKFDKFDPELEAVVNLSPQHLEQIQHGASSYAKSLVAKYWEDAFRAALEKELSEIELLGESKDPNPEAA